MRTIFYLLLAVPSATALFGDTPFRITVTDVSNAPISGAMILLHWDPAGSAVGLNSNVGLKEDLVLRTDDKGRVATELPQGFYDLFASAMAFSPSCRKIRLKGVAPSETKIRLAVDPLVIKELGDVIEAVPRRP